MGNQCCTEVNGDSSTEEYYTSDEDIVVKTMFTRAKYKFVRLAPDCAICLSGRRWKRGGAVQLQCQHRMHTECFIMLLVSSNDRKCPLCRTDF